MEGARWLSHQAGVPVQFKCENLQRTGSFKMRGAYVRISRLTAAERAVGVVAASAGNHAQGVALSAQLLGIRSTVFMPEGAPIPKVNATRGYGAEVIIGGTYLDQALVRARQFADETGAVFIPPFDHVDIVAGQGTCGLEIMEQMPDVGTVVVPTGGGGLLAGIAIAVKSIRPDTRVVGVQAAGAAAYPPSLRTGRPEQLDAMNTMADGIAVGRPGDITFNVVRDFVDDVVTVSENSISRALVALAERAKLVVEPAGAVAVAAVMDEPSAFRTPTSVVISGGNIDPVLFGKVLRHGMAAAGRYLYLGVVISDAPGGLAGLLTEVSKAGANVIDLSHERSSPELGVSEVEVGLQLETRGGAHAEQIRSQLVELGYRLAPEYPRERPD
jgi:threonine dehydratase